MKAMVCEMCHGNDLVKQDGMYVCQYCGTKYSVEEARKLFVEGTVKIDHSDEIRNLYEVARRARKEKNGASAQKYYEMILLKDPFCWEPVFYSAYYTYTDLKVNEISAKVTDIQHLLDSTISMAENLDMSSKKSAFLEIQQDIKDLADQLIVDYIAYYDSLKFLDRNVNDKMDTVSRIARLVFTMGDAYCRNHMTEKASDLYQFAISVLEHEIVFCVHDKCIVVQLSEECKSIYQRMDAASDYIRQSDPGYMTKREIHSREYNRKHPGNNTASPSKGGCYVATAVYGSYDCPQVWTLRRYRDNELAETWCGRAFIHTYYAISPTLVKWFGETEWFKRMWRGILDNMVRKLQNRGIESTPYEDRNWNE